MDASASSTDVGVGDLDSMAPPKVSTDSALSTPLSANEDARELDDDEEEEDGESSGRASIAVISIAPVDPMRALALLAFTGKFGKVGL
jgi:hypothetical protein